MKSSQQFCTELSKCDRSSWNKKQISKSYPISIFRQQEHCILWCPCTLWALLSSLTTCFSSVCGVGIIQIQVERQCQIPLLCQPKQLLNYPGVCRVFSMEARFGLWAIAHNLVIILATKYISSYGHKKEFTGRWKADTSNVLPLPRQPVKFVTRVQQGEPAGLCRACREKSESAWWTGSSYQSVIGIRWVESRQTMKHISAQRWLRKHCVSENTLLKVICWTFFTHFLLDRKGPERCILLNCITPLYGCILISGLDWEEVLCSYKKWIEQRKNVEFCWTSSYFFFLAFI